MTKTLQLRICNFALLVFLVIMLVSGIWLEATSGRSFAMVWLHVATGIIFFALIGWHIYLHFGRKNWFRRFAKLRKRLTAVLWWVTIITLISSFVALFHRVDSYTHSTLGGVHGKLGFLMLIIAIIHTIERIKFFARR